MKKKNSSLPMPLHKPSVLIAVSLSKEISTLQAKMYDLFLYNAKQQLNENPAAHEFTISIIEIKEMSKTKQRNEFIRSAFYDLLDTKVRYNILGKDNRKYPIEGGFVLVAGYESEPGIFKYSFAWQIINVLADPNIYSTLDLKAIGALKSKYSIKLYELCKDYENSPALPLLNISNFRSIFNVGKKYSDGNDLKRYVLEPAIFEINKSKLIPYIVLYQMNRGDKNRLESVKIELVKDNKQSEKCKDEIKEEEPSLFDMPNDNPYNNGSIINDVLSYLNKKLSTKFKKTKETEKIIESRIKEGYVMGNFKTVIDKKYSEWRGTDMARNLRPDVLFGDKFDIYLNQLSASSVSAVTADGQDWLINRLKEREEEDSAETVLIGDVVDNFFKNKQEV